MVRSEKTKKEFIALMEANPDWRFWQTVRNFVIDKYGFVYVSKDLWEGDDLHDTFNWEEKDG